MKIIHINWWGAQISEPSTVSFKQKLRRHLFFFPSNVSRRDRPTLPEVFKGLGESPPGGRSWHPWKLTWLAGKSPCSIGNTSSWYGGFSSQSVSFREGFWGAFWGGIPLRIQPPFEITDSRFGHHNLLSYMHWSYLNCWVVVSFLSFSWKSIFDQITICITADYPPALREAPKQTPFFGGGGKAKEFEVKILKIQI